MSTISETKLSLKQPANRSCSKAYLIIEVLALASIIVSPVAQAYAISVDGTVSDAEWIYWFKDTTFTHSSHYTGSLKFSAYWYADASNLYIAVNTTKQISHISSYSSGSDSPIDYSNIYPVINSTDEVMSEYSAGDTESVTDKDKTFTPWEQLDIRIDVPPYGIGEEDIGFGIIKSSTPDYTYTYFLNGTSTGSWSQPKPLPSGSNIVAGQTNSNRSYELIVPASLLEIQPGDIVKVAFSLYDRIGCETWALNTHPDQLCWFDPDNWEPTPPLPIPEAPIGTILLTATAFSVYFLAKRLTH